MKKMASSSLKALQDWDSERSLWIYETGQRVPRVILQGLEWSGDGLFWIPITAALCFSSTIWVQFFFSRLLTGFAFDLCVIGMMKGIIRRSRPSYNKGMHLVVSVDHYSFPSGHTSRAFLIVVFAFEYAHQWKVDVFSKVGTYVGPNIDQGLVYYALCCALVVWVLATASSRVLLGRHYLVDVVVGSIVGVLEALFVTRVLLHLEIFNETQISRLLEFTHFLWQEALSRLTG